MNILLIKQIKKAAAFFKICVQKKSTVRSAYLMVAALLLCITGFSQNITVSGKVTNSSGNVLEGVSVLAKGITGNGTTSDAKGNYQISVPSNATLVFSSVNFTLQEVAVAGKSIINIVLEGINDQLEDIVVVGYGTAKKKDLTGAVVQVKATQFENENPRSMQDMLRGNAPGLDVGFDASTKGTGSSLQVRGKGTLTASSSPLIVLDGVIYPGPLENINPNDIATIDILKDASSAAVFGARSANGVILVTSKKGKSGKPIISINSNIGMNKLEGQPKLLGPYEFLDFRGQAIWSTVGYDSTSKPNIKYRYTDPSKLPSNVSLADWFAMDPNTSSGDPGVAWLTRLKMKPVEIANYQAGKYIDWEKLIYNTGALQQDHTVSISQRKEDMSYYLSLGYLKNEGLTVGDEYKTFRLRTNLEAKAASFLTVGLNFQYSNRDQSAVPVALGSARATTPWGSYYKDDGVTLRDSPNDDIGNNSHPFMSQFYTDRLYKYDDFFASLYAKGNLPFGFSYQVNFTPRYEVLREFNHQSALNPLIASRKGIVDRENQTVYAWQIDNILRWNKSFGKHSFEATFLANAEKFQSWSDSIHAENFAPNDNLSFNALQSATLPPSIYSDDQYSTGDALMARGAYNYNQRYLLTATVRRDGYSAFGQQNPRATFTSLAAAWTLSEEKFMQSANSWLDYAKLRVSYGENGNREIGRYAALANLTSGTYVFITSGGTAYNTSYISATNLSNPGLRWERNASNNFGFDFSILRGKLNGSFDQYTRNTKDLLVNRTLSTVTGFNNILVNLGAVQNRGFEISLNSANMKKRNFEWRTGLGLWANKNKIVHLYGPTPDYDASGQPKGSSEKDDIGNGWYIGKSISAVYDYKVIGVWQLADKAQAATFGYKPGDFRLEDTNGDGKYTIADKQFLGDLAPKFSWNLRNEFKIYKNFDFSFTLYAKMGQLTQFNEAKTTDAFYDRANFYNRPFWTPSNPINDYAGLFSNAGGAVSWNVYRKSSFARLSNVALAYTVPASITHKFKVDALKAYVNVVNAHVFTNWVYFDPENKGVPTPYTINFGLNINL